MAEQAHFDRRAATYDQDKLHQRIVSLLVDGVRIEPGLSVLDIATGTGLVALNVAPQVGPIGKVIGIDVSDGMLAEARRKATDAQLHNVTFQQADAEHLSFPEGSFDRVFCCSALVLMKDIPRALRRWREFLKPDGVLAFDTPSKPFGISQKVIDAAERHDIHLTYGALADTPAKCREMLESAGFEVLDVRTELASTDPVSVKDAIAFWDQHIDHPAWRPIKEADPTIRSAMRADFIKSVVNSAADGLIPNDTALNLSYARNPA